MEWLCNCPASLVFGIYCELVLVPDFDQVVIMYKVLEILVYIVPALLAWFPP
jgi:hypothetical protein